MRTRVYAAWVPSEIERKFLVSETPPRLDGPGAAIEQGYLAISEAAEVRLRRSGEKLTLTVKRGSGEVREEVELRLYREQFDRLWPLTAGARLRKRRHLVALEGGLKAEVDIYAGALEGLRVVEVEFGSEAEARAFQPPDWIGAELTGDGRYSNQSLATAGPPRSTESGTNGKVGDMAADHVSRSYELKRGESAAEGVRRVAAGRAGKAIARLRGADADELPAAVHGARKDLKKIRAVLRLVRADLGGKAYRAENRRYRDAGRLLSDSRDAEVKLETLEALRERFPDSFPGSLAPAWKAALEADRGRIGRTGRDGEADQRERAVEAIEAAAAGIPDWPLEHDSWALLEPGLTRSYSRGRAALKRTRADGGADNVHELRKRVKDLWYHLRLLQGAWPQQLEPGAEEAHRLADLLGDHHDLAVLAADLRVREGLDASRGKAEALIARRQAELLERALELGVRLYPESPKCFRRRMRAYWRAWREES